MSKRRESSDENHSDFAVCTGSGGFGGRAEKVPMAAALKSKVRVGTDINDINSAPSNISVVSEGDSVTFKVTPPSGGRGFMRIKVE